MNCPWLSKCCEKFPLTLFQTFINSLSNNVISVVSPFIKWGWKCLRGALDFDKYCHGFTENAPPVSPQPTMYTHTPAAALPLSSYLTFLALTINSSNVKIKGLDLKLAFHLWQSIFLQLCFLFVQLLYQYLITFISPVE